jgi:hypothetical protein
MLIYGFYHVIFSWSVSIVFIWSIPVLLIGVALHELIHGVCFSIFSGKPLSFIKYGFDKKTFTPYAHCKAPIPTSAYKIGALMPAIILGIAPYIAALFTGNIYLFLFGTFFTTAAYGDFIVFWIIKDINNNALVEDHPSRAGCFIYIDSRLSTQVFKTDPALAFQLHHQYRLPFLFLLFSSGIVLGYRVFSVITSII